MRFQTFSWYEDLRLMKRITYASCISAYKLYNFGILKPFCGTLSQLY